MQTVHTRRHKFGTGYFEGSVIFVLLYVNFVKKSRRQDVISSFSDISPIRRLPRGILVARLLGGLVLGDLVAVAGV